MIGRTGPKPDYNLIYKNSQIAINDFLNLVFGTFNLNVSNRPDIQQDMTEIVNSRNEYGVSFSNTTMNFVFADCDDDCRNWSMN